MITKLTTTIICMLLATGMLISCKKDAETVPKEKGIIEDPANYVVYIRLQSPSGSAYYDELYDFSPDNKMYTYTPEIPQGAIRNYSRDGNILKIEGTMVEITQDKVTNEGGWDIKDFAILKKQSSNQLAGKVYTGVYYKNDGSVLHPSFFYQFHPSSTTKKAGLVFPTVAREDTYILIGGVAALGKNIPGYPGDAELLVLVNEKLYVNYYDSTNDKMYSGIFSKQQ